MQNKKPEINTTVSLESQFVHLDNSDNGNGVTSEQQKKIFDPFDTTRRNQGGSRLNDYSVSTSTASIR